MKMNHLQKKILIPVFGGIALLLTGAIFLGSSFGSPGSIEDPVITKSYLEEKTAVLKKEIEDLEKQFLALQREQNQTKTDDIKRLDDDITELERAILKLSSLSGRVENLEKLDPNNFQVKYEAVEFKVGQRILGKESSEIILRSGTARAIGSSAGGIVDVTSETKGNLGSLEEVPLNHLLIIPRDDGRGIQITSSNAWVLIKGGYELR